MDNSFYVYQLRLESDYLPFYIGKGKGSRAWVHLSPVGTDKSYKSNKIRKAQREGKYVFVEFIKMHLSEDDAHIWEAFYIAEYGRKDLGVGPLLNLTDGGEGLANPSIETRRRISEGNTGKIVSEEVRARMSLSAMGNVIPLESRKKIGESNSRRIVSEDTRKKMSESRRGENNPSYGKTPSEDTRLKIAEGNKGKTRSEETRKRMSEGSMKRKLISCPHCGAQQTANTIYQYHFDKCKKAIKEV